MTVGGARDLAGMVSGGGCGLLILSLARSPRTQKVQVTVTAELPVESCTAVLHHSLSVNLKASGCLGK